MPFRHFSFYFFLSSIHGTRCCRRNIINIGLEGTGAGCSIGWEIPPFGLAWEENGGASLDCGGMVYLSLLIRHCYQSGQCVVRINGSFSDSPHSMPILRDSFVKIQTKLSLHQVWQ
jgi:hypothetical protein